MKQLITWLILHTFECIIIIIKLNLSSHDNLFSFEFQYFISHSIIHSFHFFPDHKDLLRINTALISYTSCLESKMKETEREGERGRKRVMDKWANDSCPTLTLTHKYKFSTNTCISVEGGSCYYYAEIKRLSERMNMNESRYNENECDICWPHFIGKGRKRERERRERLRIINLTPFLIITSLHFLWNRKFMFVIVIKSSFLFPFHEIVIKLYMHREREREGER